MEKLYKVGTNPKTGNDIMLKMKKNNYPSITNIGDNSTCTLHMEFMEEKNIALFGNDLQDYLQEVFLNMDCYDKCDKLEELDCAWSEVGSYWYDELDMMETLENFEHMLENQGKDYIKVEYSSDFGEYYAVMDREELEYGEILKMELSGDIDTDIKMKILALHTMTNGEVFTNDEFTNFGYQKLYEEIKRYMVEMEY